MAETARSPKRSASTRKPSTKAAPATDRIRANKHQAPARPDAVLQRRGAERVQAILDAAETLLAEEGYEAATLKAIGERAGIPIASVYHYFSDRHQVDTEIIGRHIAELDQQLSKSLDGDVRLDSVQDVVDAVIDPMLTYFRTHPSCVQLWFSGRSDAVAELVQSFDESTAERMLQLGVQRELLRQDTPPLVIQLAFEVGNRLFDVAFRRTPNTGDDATIAEARRLLGLYLQSYAPESERPEN
ncbi:TetR/AcrR family transcriptional regulator [Nocardia sp. NPDC059246]|uniref:TetR/AcrR family transcriptional regulator n=1 Tax=unclassified Nocardia TaxID=2637762 RepID=UPI0036776EE9